MANERSESIGNIDKQIKESIPVIEGYVKLILDLKQGINQLKTEAKKVKINIDDNRAQQKETVQNLKDSNALRSQALTILNKEETLKQKKIRTDQQLAREAESMEKNLIKQNKLIEQETNAYKKLSKETREYKNEAKRLEVELLKLERAGKKGNKEHIETAANLRKVGKAAIQGDKDLKRIDKQYGDSFRNVGNYKSALGGLKTAMVQLGVGFGVFQGLREGVEVLTEFDEKVADIQKTTGLQKGEAITLSQDLFDIDTKTSIANLQELVEAGGRLNIQGVSNLKEFAESADKVFVALGDDLEGSADEIATNLGKIAAQFGLEDEFGIGPAIEKVGSGINQLAASSKASAPAILDFTNRMAGLSQVLELSDVQALGALFDESGQSIEVAGSTLLKLLPELSKNFEKFAKVAGETPEDFKRIAEESPIEALKLVASGAKNSEKGLFNLTKVLEGYGVESARATGIVSTLTNNVDRLTELQKLSSEAIEDGTSVIEEFDTKNDTLSATLAKASKKIKEQVIAFSQTTGAANGLKNAIQFITNNLGLLIKIIGKATLAFVTYRAVVKSLKLIDQVKNWRKVNNAIKENADATKDASKGAKEFGTNIKAIGFTAIIAGLTEVAVGFYDIASGARQAAFDTKVLNEELAKGAKQTDAFIAKRKQERDLALSLAETDKDGVILESERLRIQKEFVGALRENKNGVLELLRAEKERNSDLQEVSDSTEGYVRLLFEQADAYRDVFKEGDDVDDLLGKSDALIAKYQASVDALGLSLTGSSEEQAVFNAEVARGAKGSKEAEKRVSLLRKIEDEQIKRIADDTDRAKTKSEVDAQREIEDLKRTTAVESEKAQLIEEININLNETLKKLDKEEADRIEALRLERLKRLQELNEQVLEAARGATGNVEVIPEDFLKEKEFEDALKKRRLELLKSNKSDEEIAEELTKFRIEQLEEQILIRENIMEDAIDHEIELAELQRDKEQEILNERLANTNRWIQASSDALTEYYDARIQNQVDLGEAEKRVQDILIANSDKGVASGEKSIAKQNELIRKAQAERIRLEKEKQAIEFATAAILTFTKALESGKTVPEAFGEVALTQGGLALILNQLPKFFHGSEDTGNVGMFNDKFGSVTGVTHANESVLDKGMTAEKHKAGFTNRSMLDAALKYNDIESNPALAASMLGGFPTSQLMSMPKTVTPIILNQNKELEKKIDQTNDKLDKAISAIKGQKYPESRTGQMISDLMTFIDSDGKGNEQEHLIQRGRKGISRSTRKPNYRRS